MAWVGKVRRSVFFPPWRFAPGGFCLYICAGLFCLVAELVRDESFKHLMFGMAIFSIRGEIRVFSRRNFVISARIFIFARSYFSLLIL